MKVAVRLFQKNRMQSKRLEHLYPLVLLEQYRVRQHKELHPFILSPATYINDKEEILFCKQCYEELSLNNETRKIGYPPVQSIANGFVIGDAPDIFYPNLML